MLRELGYDTWRSGLFARAATRDEPTILSCVFLGIVLRFVMSCALHLDAKPYTSKGNTNRCSECARLYRRKRYDALASTYHGSHGAYIVAKSAAKFRGVLFDLTYEQWRDIVSQPCAYRITDEPLIRVGIDQNIAGQGYTATNSIPCCGKHNRQKSDILTYEQMLDAVHRYRIPCGNDGAGRRRLPR